VVSSTNPNPREAAVSGAWGQVLDGKMNVKGNVTPQG
jgi:hypothetical protein